jgi:hypothetical protein
VIGAPEPAVAGAEVHVLPVDGEGALSLLAGVLDKAGAACHARFAEDQVDVIAGVLVEQLIAERRTCASSETSQAWPVTATPGGAAARAVAAVTATESGFRSNAATEQPCAASWRTSSRPMPEPPPVTIASLPVIESTAMIVNCGAIVPS